MQTSLRFVALFIFMVVYTISNAQSNHPKTIISGVPWYDQQGRTISAHGGCIVRDNERWYFFGEQHADSSNVFTGFTCYSSPDLSNWKFESIALPQQDSGKLGPNRVGERPKVMRCPATGEYVMFMHSDDRAYKDACVAFATAKQITGPYTYRGALLLNGKPLKRWDMGTFQDNDGNGYILTHGGDIYKLSTDYKHISETVAHGFAPNTESPAIMHKGNIYFWLCSYLTSWERNDNTYYTAPSVQGPWTYRGLFAPQGTLTWNSQTTFVLPVAGKKDTAFMYMGDRWSFPHQNSSATYVWQPITVIGNTLSIPEFQSAWYFEGTAVASSVVPVRQKKIGYEDRTRIKYQTGWKADTVNGFKLSASDQKGSSFSVTFAGTKISLAGVLRPDGGYAQVLLRNNKNKKIVLSSLIDMYCKYAASALCFVSPQLPKGTYTLTVSVAGEHGNWSDKRKTNYGSTGNYVSIQHLLVNN